MKKNPSTPEKVADIIARDDQLHMARAPWLDVWRRIADYFLPTQGSMGLSGSTSLDTVVRGPVSRERYQVRFDSTAMACLDRMCSGVQGLITPDNEEWHELAMNDFVLDEVSSEESAFLARVNKLLFKTRYAPSSGFSSANTLAGRSNGAFGTGAFIVLDGRDTFRPLANSVQRIVYQHIPLGQAKFAENAQGEHDTMYRRWSMTARQLAQQFGIENVSDSTRKLLDDPKKWDTMVEIIHAIQPRSDYDPRYPDGSNRNMPFMSIYVEVKDKHLLRESGFNTFPVITPRWYLSEGSAYGESPCMLALEDVQGLNVMKRASLRAFQQHVDPPIAVAHDGVMTRPNMNPGAINVGGVTAEGRPKILPLMTSMNPGLAKEVLDQERGTVKDILLNNLFQILADNPQMTAQEVLVRSGEKADLLAPAGVTMAAAYSRLVERELDILIGQGMYESRDYAPPQSMQGRSYAFRSSSPMDRLRRSKKLIAVQTVLQTAAAAGAAAQQPGGDNIDVDATIKFAVESTGAPVEMLRRAADVAAEREQKMNAAAQERQMAMLSETAKAAGAAAPAMKVAMEQQQGAGLGA